MQARVDFVAINPTALTRAGIGFAVPIFAFGLLGMDSVTIAVGSFGPVSDSAQSVHELSHIEFVPNVEKGIASKFGFLMGAQRSVGLAHLHLDRSDGDVEDESGGNEAVHGRDFGWRSGTLSGVGGEEELAAEGRAEEAADDGHVDVELVGRELGDELGGNDL